MNTAHHRNPLRLSRLLLVLFAAWMMLDLSACTSLGAQGEGPTVRLRDRDRVERR
jgi:hypothetical protein